MDWEEPPEVPDIDFDNEPINMDENKELLQYMNNQNNQYSIINPLG